ncbi:mitochondrial genome maintenance exonuclease 1 isoform X1 [Paramormyrops kingsleyae]|uniref:mitochondrial genome maintenance exonuclease 1 isoform X1 n=1 Tax=Paramormyrops kingsleyae TaxID=1676925 RepID=UPI000CD64356|nr:mitochondrial genome maintenance exonuclease 1 isoform X1 [Paramormyrops kingsleyae]
MEQRKTTIPIITLSILARNSTNDNKGSLIQKAYAGFGFLISKMKCTQLLNQIRHVSMKGLVASFFPYCALCPVACLSTSSRWSTRKKSSQYSSVDTEKYSSLVRSVLSRTSSQTPASLKEEDEHIFGPIIKSKPAFAQECKVPKSSHPLVYPDKTLDRPSEDEGNPPMRIAMQRGASKVTVPSVTKILQQTMPPEQAFYLERWKERMIAELGEEGFKEYTINIFRQGRRFHSALESILIPEEELSSDTGSSESVEGYIESVRHVLREIRGVRAIESVVQHQSLNYLGLVDCVAMYRGELCVIDWKTSEKPKPHLRNTYDNPLQIAAYMGAINDDGNYNYQVQNGLIVVAYKDGSPAHVHFMKHDVCLVYWNRWLIRLEEFKEKV